MKRNEMAARMEQMNLDLEDVRQQGAHRHGQHETAFRFLTEEIRYEASKKKSQKKNTVFALKFFLHYQHHIIIDLCPFQTQAAQGPRRLSTDGCPGSCWFVVLRSYLFIYLFFFVFLCDVMYPCHRET